MSGLQTEMIPTFKPVETYKHQENPKVYLRRRAALALSLLAIGTGLFGGVANYANAKSRGTKQSHALEFVGFNDNNAMLPDPVEPGQVMDSTPEADQIMAEDAAAGAKDIRIIEYFYAGRNDMGRADNPRSDLNRTCNSVIAADKYGMETIISFEGSRYFPQYGLSQKWATLVESKAIWGVYGPNGCDTQWRLAHKLPPAEEAILSPWNAPDNNDFSIKADSQKLADEWVNLVSLIERSAQQNSNLITQANADAAAKAGVSGGQFNERVLVGELDPRGALSFIKRACSNVLFKDNQPEAFALHPYPSASDEDPSVVHNGDYVGEGDYSQVESAFQQYCGWQQTNLIYTEVGRQTNTDGDPQYYDSKPKKLTTISEQQQGQLYFRDYNTAACQDNVDGLLLFHDRDDGSRKLIQSGIRKPNGDEKGSFPLTSAAMIDASKDAGFDCSTQQK